MKQQNKSEIEFYRDTQDLSANQRIDTIRHRLPNTTVDNI